MTTCWRRAWRPLLDWEAVWQDDLSSTYWNLPNRRGEKYTLYRSGQQNNHEEKGARSINRQISCKQTSLEEEKAESLCNRCVQTLQTDFLLQLWTVCNESRIVIIIISGYVSVFNGWVVADRFTMFVYFLLGLKVHVCVYLYIYMCGYIYYFIYMCIYIFVYIYMCVYILYILDLYICVYIYIYTHTYIYICVYIFIYIMVISNQRNHLILYLLDLHVSKSVYKYKWTFW